MFHFRFRIRVLPLLWIFSIGVAAFCYGFGSHRYQWFPYGILRDAFLAASALTGAGAEPEPGGLQHYARHVTQPTAISHAAHPDTDLILISGGRGYLTTHHVNGCLAWIVDRQGDVQHVWQNDPNLWNDLQQVTHIPGISGDISPAGLHVYDDGGLLVTFHGYNTFPFAIGIARFDRDSRLLWKRELLTHHSFSVAPDGRIFVPALEVVPAPFEIAGTGTQIESDTGFIYHDQILILDEDGNELQRISMLDAMRNSGWIGHLTRGNATSVRTDDPLHLNDVQLITDTAAAGQHTVKPGDLLVSFRNINTIAVLDPTTETFRWMSSGATIGQHSPRLVGNAVVTLDNLGGDPALGGTRLVGIDLLSGQPQVLFPLPDVPAPDLCRTVNSGFLDVAADGRHVLMTVSHEGAVWEIDLETGRVVWEYIYVHPGSDGSRQLIGNAKYIRSPGFLTSSIPATVDPPSSFTRAADRIERFSEAVIVVRESE